MSEGKKYAIIIPTLGMGGAERVASELANEMASRNICVKILLLDDMDLYYNLDKKIDVTFIDFDKTKNKISKNVYRIKKIRSFLIDNSIDFAISFLTSANFLSILSTLGTKTKVFVSERSNPDMDSRKIKVLRSFLYKFADGCVFQTNDAMNFFGKGIKKKSIVIENPVKRDLPKWKNANKHEKNIITACRLEKSKNLPMLLKAFSIVRKKTNCNLFIYGDGPEKETIIDLVEKEGLSSCVKLMGRDAAWHNTAINCSVFAISSDYEGMSNSLLEAISMGMPVVSTDHPVGGAKALIDDGVNGFLVPVNDHKAMAKRILELLDDDNLKEKFSIEAEKINAKLSIDKITDRWLSFLNK